MNKLSLTPVCRQRGATTLLITVVILVLITLVSLYTSRSVLMEQKITNADFRNKEAFEAAEAGLRRAIEYLDEDMDQNDDDFVDSVFIDSTGNGDADTNVLALSSGATATVTLPEGPASIESAFPLLIRSDGRSADGSALRTVWQTISILNPLPNVPTNPITAKGTVVIGGSATVHNPEGHSTVWSGSNVALGSNQSTATQIANPNDANYPTCMDDGSCSVTQASNNNYVGVDVVEYDASLASLDDAAFFKNFFGMTKQDYRQTMVTQDLSSSSADVSSTDDMLQEIIWIDGDASFTGGPTIGSANEPVILIVDGNASFSGNTNIHGIVMVMGDLNMTGNTTVTGALVSNGNTSNATGSLDVYYNSSVLFNTTKSAPFTSSPGSWRDFPGDA
jgi:hypothetical protein